MKKETNLVQSLVRGLVGLEMAIQDGAVKPVDLAEKLEIDRSSAYRLLYTLMHMGYLNQDPESRKFVPNAAKMLRLNSRFDITDDWISLVNVFLKKLCQETNESANMGILDGDTIMYIGQVHTENGIRVHNPVGIRREIYSSALGKAISAFLAEERLREILSRAKFINITPKTITDPDVFLLQLRTVREKGYALDDEETIEGVRCIAAPVFNKEGIVIAALGISAPINTVVTEKIPLYGSIVKRIASEASQALGYIC